MRYLGVTKLVSFWITPEDYGRVKGICAEKRCSVSPWLRRLVLTELNRMETLKESKTMEIEKESAQTNR